MAGVRCLLRRAGTAAGTGMAGDGAGAACLAGLLPPAPAARAALLANGEGHGYTPRV